MDDSLVTILSELVATPSVNPMGRGDCMSAPWALEGRLTDLLAARLERLPGCRLARQPVAPGRENLLASLEGEPGPAHGGALVLLDAHQDTVPADGMTIEPFTPRIEDGRLYGRGACDTKGGMAAMIGALVRLARERPAPRPTVVLAFPVDEEHGFSGVKTLTRLWSDGAAGQGLLPRRPDAAVVAEPTSLGIVVAHKGVVRWRCHARGRAAHAAAPSSGENAIYRMAHLLAALESYADRLALQSTHPRCGGATLNVGTIRGGVSVNTVPDCCTIEIDRRLIPGESPGEARRAAVAVLAEQGFAAPRIDHDPPWMDAPALTDEANGPLAEALAAGVRGVEGEAVVEGVPYATDAAWLAAAGVPAVVFGPGSIAQAHTRDEWIELAQVERAAEILYRFITAFSPGVRPR